MKKFKLKAETGRYDIKITDSITITSESNHLFYSNREKVSKILEKPELDQNDIIDVFVSLHIVLELGINNVFRKIITPTFKKQIDTHIMIQNLDNINFIDKVVMFVYFGNFNFDNIEIATKYHSIINKLKAFSEMRNKLLHGHSISEISTEGKNSKSNLKKNLNSIKLKEQLNNFAFILTGLCYYIDCFDSKTLTDSGKNQFKETYLSWDFIPKGLLNNEK